MQASVYHHPHLSFLNSLRALDWNSETKHSYHLSYSAHHALSRRRKTTSMYPSYDPSAPGDVQSPLMQAAVDKKDLMNTWKFPQSDKHVAGTNEPPTIRTVLPSSPTRPKSWISLDEYAPSPVSTKNVEAGALAKEIDALLPANPLLPVWRRSKEPTAPALSHLQTSLDEKTSVLSGLPKSNPSYDMAYFLKNSGPPEKDEYGKKQAKREGWKVLRKGKGVMTKFNKRGQKPRSPPAGSTITQDVVQKISKDGKKYLAIVTSPAMLKELGSKYEPIVSAIERSHPHRQPTPTPRARRLTTLTENSKSGRSDSIDGWTPTLDAQQLEHSLIHGLFKDELEEIQSVSDRKEKYPRYSSGSWFQDHSCPHAAKAQVSELVTEEESDALSRSSKLSHVMDPRAALTSNPITPAAPKQSEMTLGEIQVHESEVEIEVIPDPEDANAPNDDEPIKQATIQRHVSEPIISSFGPQGPRLQPLTQAKLRSNGDCLPGQGQRRPMGPRNRGRSRSPKKHWPNSTYQSHLPIRVNREKAIRRKPVLTIVQTCQSPCHARTVSEVQKSIRPKDEEEGSAANKVESQVTQTMVTESNGPSSMFLNWESKRTVDNTEDRVSEQTPYNTTHTESEHIQEEPNIPVPPKRSLDRPALSRLAFDTTAAALKDTCKTGCTPISPNTQTMTLTPVMLVAEQVPVDAKAVQKPPRLILRERALMDAIAVGVPPQPFERPDSVYSIHAHSTRNLLRSVSDTRLLQHDHMTTLTFANGVFRPRSTLSLETTVGADASTQLSSYLSPLPLPLNFPKPPQGVHKRSSGGSVKSMHSQGTQTEKEREELGALRRQNKLLEATLEAMLAVLKAGGMIGGTKGNETPSTHHGREDSGLGAELSTLEMYLRAKESLRA